MLNMSECYSFHQFALQVKDFITCFQLIESHLEFF